MKHPLGFILFLLCAILMTVTNVFPQDTPYRLDDIVVTASRIDAPLKEAPANITIITKETIEEEGAKTIDDVLKTEAGVFTTNMLGNPKSATIDIRGYGETSSQNVLVLVDGRRINDVDMSRPDFSQVPIEMIERIEIYRGPNSVLFGDNAIGGVINIILKKGEGKPKVTARTNAGSYGLIAPYKSLSGQEKKFSYYVQTSSYDTDGYRHNNGYHGRDVNGNFSFDVSDMLAFTVKVGHHKDRYGMPGALTFQQLQTGLYDRKDSVTPFDNARTEDNYVDVGAQIKLHKDLVFSVNGSFRDRHSSSTWAFYNWDSTRTMKTYGLTPKITYTKERGALKNVLIGGFDYYRSPTTSNDSSLSGAFPSITDIEKKDYAFYVNDELTIAKKLILTAGYRLNKARYDFDYTDLAGFLAPVNSHLNEKNEAFRTSANYLFQDGNLFATYSKGFRLPTTDEFFSPFSVHPINPNLKPQTSYEIDVGIRWNPFKTAGGSLTLFQAKTDNEIYFNPITFENRNYDRTKRQGIEAALNLLVLRDLRLNMTYTYLKAIFDGGAFGGNNVPFVPRNKFSSKLIYSYGDFTFNLVGLYTGNRFMNSDPENRFKRIPGVTTFDFNIDYRHKDLALFFGIKNITGQQYYEFGTVSGGTMYFYPAPERQFLLGIQYALGG